MKLVDITNEGWPVAQPKFNNLPSANIIIECPSGNVHLSTYGLMFNLYIPGQSFNPFISISLSKCPIFPTIALCFI